MDGVIYLPSYDRHAEFLGYNVGNGSARIVSRQSFQQLGVAQAFGWFMRENASVAGIFASPEGPTLFLDARRLVARFGDTEAMVHDVGRNQKLFVVTHKGASVFELTYAQRHGIGTNPYDRDPEDVDLCALIAKGLANEAYVRNYTRPTVG